MKVERPPTLLPAVVGVVRLVVRPRLQDGPPEGSLRQVALRVAGKAVRNIVELSIRLLGLLQAPAPLCALIKSAARSLAEGKRQHQPATAHARRLQLPKRKVHALRALQGTRSTAL